MSTLYECVTRVVAWYKRHSYRIDCWEDAVQEAALAVLLAERSNPKVTDLQRKAAASYAVRRHLYNSGSPVMHQHRPERLKGLTSAPLCEDTLQDDSGETSIIVEDWRGKCRAELLTVMGGDAAVGVAVLLDEVPPKDAAEQLGLPVVSVYTALQSVRRRAKRSPQLAQLMADCP